MKDLWTISTTEHAGDKESIMRRGNVYQIANGYMGYNNNWGSCCSAGFYMR